MDRAPETPSLVNRVQVGDISLAVTEYEGDGPPLFLLHGIGSNHTTWWPVIDHLAEHFRLIVPDWRGHGASDKPDAGYLVRDYATDLNGLLNAYGFEQPMVMGHSLGGMSTLSWATRHPNKARRIVIEDAPLRRHPNVQELFDGWISLATQPLEMTAAHYARDYPSWTPEECRRRAATLAATNLSVFTELRDHNLRDDGSDRIAPLATIQSPLLFVHGDVESGGMVPLEDAERIGATIPSATVKRIHGGSHSLHRDCTKEFVATVVPFLLAP
jgi:pimeloyl-ACP methyl ester carboxylesterase